MSVTRNFYFIWEWRTIERGADNRKWYVSKDNSCKPYGSLNLHRGNTTRHICSSDKNICSHTTNTAVRFRNTVTKVAHNCILPGYTNKSHIWTKNHDSWCLLLPLTFVFSIFTQCNNFRHKSLMLHLFIYITGHIWMIYIFFSLINSCLTYL